MEERRPTNPDQEAKDEKVLEDVGKDNPSTRQLIQNLRNKIPDTIGKGVVGLLLVKYGLRGRETNEYTDNRHRPEVEDVTKLLRFWRFHHLLDLHEEKSYSKREVVQLIANMFQALEMINVALGEEYAQGGGKEVRVRVMEMVRLYHIFGHYEQVQLNSRNFGTWKNHLGCKRIGSSQLGDGYDFVRRDGRGALCWHNVDDPEDNFPYDPKNNSQAETLNNLSEQEEQAQSGEYSESMGNANLAAASFDQPFPTLSLPDNSMQEKRALSEDPESEPPTKRVWLGPSSAYTWRGYEMEPNPDPWAPTKKWSGSGNDN